MDPQLFSTPEMREAGREPCASHTTGRCNLDVEAKLLCCCLVTGKTQVLARVKERLKHTAFLANVGKFPELLNPDVFQWPLGGNTVLQTNAPTCSAGISDAERGWDELCLCTCLNSSYRKTELSCR